MGSLPLRRRASSARVPSRSVMDPPLLDTRTCAPRTCALERTTAARYLVERPCPSSTPSAPSPRSRRLRPSRSATPRSSATCSGRTAVLTDGKLTFTMQEGLWPGGPEDRALFERSQPYRLFGPSARRPSSEDALLGTVAEQALLGLHAPLLTFIDLRELLALPLDLEYLRARAEGLGLSRALHGATLLVAHFFPESADTAARLRPPLGLAERLAVERVVESAKDPARLRHVRGADQAARLVVAP